MIEQPENIKKGNILIADPILDELYFRRGVILISEHNEDGTIGFVLNKEIDLRINEAIEDFGNISLPVYLGGPVSKDNLYYVHTVGKLIKESRPITNKLFFGGHFDTLKTLIIEGKIKENEVRFFLGYSGWAPGQLEEELKEESWFVGNIKRKYVFEPNKNLWRDTLKDLGKEYAIIANFPEDPSMN